MRRVKGALGLGAFALCAAIPVSAMADDLDQAIRNGFNVSGYQLETIQVPATAQQPFSMVMELGGVERTLVLEPFSMRADNFQVLIDDGSGVLKPFDVGPSPLMRGTVEGIDGATVAASIIEGEFSALVTIPGKTFQQFWVQSVTDVDADQPADLYAVWSNLDVVPTEHVCGVEDHDHDHDGDIFIPDFGGGFDAGAGDASGNAGTGSGGDYDARLDVFQEAQIAIEGDFQFYQDNGSNVTQTTNRIEQLMGVVEAVYERDVEITYAITTILIRTSSGQDPYSSNDAGTLLGQFQSWWNGNQGGVTRDVAHLFTGRSLNGGTIGVAYLGVICNRNSAYGLSENFTSSNTSMTGLIAHEIGHNWNAPHCNGASPCYIMCSGLGGCNGLGNPVQFAPTTINTIVAFRNSRSCLTEVTVGLAELPFVEPFPSSQGLDASRWAENNGAAIQNDTFAPSQPFALKMGPGDSVLSLELALANPPGPIFIDFQESRLSLEGGEALIFEMSQGPGGSFVEIGRLTSSGDAFTPYAPVSFEVPASTYINGSQLRIRTSGLSGNDVWSIDDINVEALDGQPLPFFHDFPGASLDLNIWPAGSGGTSISTDAVNEPSPPYTVRLRFGDTIQSLDFLAASEAGNPHVFSFFAQKATNEDSDLLIAQYFNDLGVWTNLDVILSSELSSTQFTQFEYELPADAFHDDLSIRFQASANAADDAFYIDDVSIQPGTIADPCPADLTGSSDPNDPSYGIGDGDADGDDFFFYLDAFASSNLSVCDLTGSSDPNDPTYGSADGDCDGDDFFFYLDLFAQGCP
ncbi:MAG: M12 family metallo-peptidase [Phycisphaerales bacterium JB037]